MTQPRTNPKTGDFESFENEHSIVLKIGDPTADKDFPALRFAADGRVVRAYVIPYVDVTSSTANFVKVGLLNGGSGDPPNGTASVAAQVPGTSGLTAGKPVALTIASGDFKQGEWCVVDYDEDGTVAPDLAVQIDYQLKGI